MDEYEWLQHAYTCVALERQRAAKRYGVPYEQIAAEFEITEGFVRRIVMRMKLPSGTIPFPHSVPQPKGDLHKAVALLKAHIRMNS